MPTRFGMSSALVAAAADVRNVQIMGRHLNTSQGFVFDNPGVQIRARFTGPSINGYMSKTGEVDDYFVVYCDGKEVASELSSASFSTNGWTPGERVNVKLCQGLDPNSEHEVVLFKSTEARFNSLYAANQVTFVRFLGPKGVVDLLEPPALPSRRLEFLGDSITAGFCNLCESVDEAEKSRPIGESFALGWPNLICQQLNADCHTIAWSGFKMYDDTGRRHAPDIWRRTLASVPDSDPSALDNKWDFSSWRPDGVVINLGTNDHLEKHPENINVYNSTYLDLVLQAASAYGPNVRFFLACGPMSDKYCPEVEWVIQQAVARNVHAQLLDQRGLDDGTHGPKCCGHPGVEIDAVVASKGAQAIGDALGWSEMVV